MADCRKLKVAVIGQGRSGYGIHTRAFLDHLSDIYELVAVSDLSPDRCREAHVESGAVVFQDWHEMLDTVKADLVVNTTPSFQHIPVTLDVLNRGFHVLCEKPFGRTAADVDNAIACARRNNRLLTVFQQSRFAPTFCKVREVMESGVLGRIVQIKVAFNNFARRWDWQTLQSMDAGNLLNTGPHPLDQALELFGPKTYPEVFCVMDRANTSGDAEDHVKMMLRAPGHPVVDIEISSCCVYTPYVYQVYGTNGGLTGDHGHLEWKYFKPEEAETHSLKDEPMPDRAYCSETLTWYEDRWDSTPAELDFQYRVEKLYRQLYDHLVNGGPFEITMEQIRRQIAVIEECHRQNPLSKAAK